MLAQNQYKSSFVSAVKEDSYPRAHSLISWVNTYRKTLEHILATLSAGFSKLGALLVLIINNKLMLPQEFGAFSLLFIITGMIGAIVSGGGDMWLNPFTHFNRATTSRAPLVARFYIKQCLLLAGIFVISALCLIKLEFSIFNISSRSLGFVFIYGAVIGINEALLAVIRTTNRVVSFFLIRDFLFPCVLITALILFSVHESETFFLLSSCIFAPLSVFLGLYLWKNAPFFFPHLRSENAIKKPLLWYTCGLITNNLSSRLYGAIDSIVLSFFVSAGVLGQYRLCTQLANGFIIVQHFAFLALPWQFHRLSEHQSEGKSSTEIAFRQKLLILTALIALMALISLSNIFLGFLSPGAQALQIPFVCMLIIKFSELLWGPLHEKLISRGKVAQDLLANLMACSVSVILFFCIRLFMEPIIAAVLSVLGASLMLQVRRYLFLIKLKAVDNITPLVLTFITCNVLIVCFLMTYFA